MPRFSADRQAAGIIREILSGIRAAVGSDERWVAVRANCTVVPRPSRQSEGFGSMNLRDDFARSLRIAYSATSKLDGADLGLVADMVDRAEAALKSAEWFVFSDPLSFDVMRRESEAIRPAIASGLVGLPFPVTGFILRMLMKIAPGAKPAWVTKEYYEKWVGTELETRVALVAEATDAPCGPGQVRSGWRVDAFVNGFDNFVFRPICEMFLAEHEGDIEFFPHVVREDDRVILSCGVDIVGSMFNECLYTALGMLLTPQVKRDRPRLSRSQAASRAAKRLPTTPVTYIQTRAWLGAALETHRRDLGLNDRSGPRPHLRRGHVRTYVSGHKVWINPMIVGANGDDSIVVRRDRYEVKAPPQLMKKTSGSVVYYTPKQSAGL